MENTHGYTISNIIGIIEHTSMPTSYLVTKKAGITGAINDDSIEEYYEELFNNFQNLLNIERLEKSDIITIHNYLTEAKVAKAILEENFKVYTHNYNSSLYENLSSYEKNLYAYNKLAFSLKIETLSLIVNSLNQEISFLNFTPTTGSKKDLIDLNTAFKTDNSEKATFNLSKKESIMLIYILEKSNLLNFQNEEQRRRFIEENFCFTEMRDNNDKGKSLPMKDVSSEISKLKSYSDAESNNKVLRKLIDKLESLDSYKF